MSSETHVHQETKQTFFLREHTKMLAARNMHLSASAQRACAKPKILALLDNLNEKIRKKFTYCKLINKN